MKLVIVTAVREFRKELVKLFKLANIENFSEAEIDGHKTDVLNSLSENWFATAKPNNESLLFFSFTEEKHIDSLFNLIKTFNSNLETHNPVRAVVIPIEKSI